MNEIATVHPQVIDGLKQKGTFVTDQSVVFTQGAGKAYQAVSLSTSTAVQDATEYLRNVSTIAATAIGAASAKMVETKDPSYALVIDAVNKAMESAAQNLATIGASAASIANSYPTGSGSGQ